MYMHVLICRSVPGKRPWALKHNLLRILARMGYKLHNYYVCMEAATFTPGNSMHGRLPGSVDVHNIIIMQ